tara:strand:+ start:281 stop:424 length:144 start_codon:yes stop_codon:yes gene_type:complete
MKKPQEISEINWKDGTTTKKYKGAVVTVKNTKRKSFEYYLELYKDFI